jgi:hypothetical protein
MYALSFHIVLVCLHTKLEKGVKIVYFCNFSAAQDQFHNPKTSDWLSGKEIFELYLEVFKYITKSRDVNFFAMNPRCLELNASGSHCNNRELKAAFTRCLGQIKEIVKKPDPTSGESASHSGHWVYCSAAKAELGLRM